VDISLSSVDRAGTYSAGGLGIAESIWEHTTRKKKPISGRRVQND